MDDAKDSCFSSFCMEEYFGDTHSSSVWNMVPACMMWLIWREGNTRTIEDVESLIFSSLCYLGLCLSGLVFGVLCNVFPFLISFKLLLFLFDLFVIVSSTVCLSS